jgi:hypothetical protein
MDMRTRDREYLKAELDRRLEWMLRRFGETHYLVPRMPPWETYAGMRRKVARLRAGKVRLAPWIPPHELADLMERSIEQEMLIRSVAADMNEMSEIERKINGRLEVERFRRSVAAFHRLKQSPEAADPASPVAEKVRRIHRTRKNQLGRRRKRKG